VVTRIDGFERRSAVRRALYEKWYIPDIQLLRAMNANTVYVFLDFGASPVAKAVLDYLYENGLKAIVHGG